MAKILVAGLNPAWQQVLILQSLRAGDVNRARGSRVMAGGKGMNAAKILARAGHDVTLLQVVAGVNGQRMLDACGALGIRSLHATCEGETRAAITLLHDGGATEVIEPFEVAAHEADRVRGTLLAAVPAGSAYDALLVCGTLPAGLDEGLYAEILGRVSCAEAVWDSLAGFNEEVATKITWLKVNAAEYRDLAPVLGASGAHPAVLVTDGPAPTVVRDSGAAGSYALPTLEKIVNPIGAGDTVTAVLTDGWLRGLPPEIAVKKALAAGMASCLSPSPAEWNPEDAARLEREIRWEQ
jgi:fructose-1-phosphate kinase PfkB-like protein